MADETIRRIIELQVRASQDSVRRLDDIARSARNVESVAERAGRAFSSLSSVLASGAFLGVAAAITRIATSLDDVGDAAQRAGTTAGFMGWLDRIGRANETDLPELERAMRALNLSLDEAQDSGSGAAKAFKQLGIDSSTLGVEDLPRIARAISEIGDTAERTRIITELFGKAGYNLSLTLDAIAAKGGDAEKEIAAFSDKMRDAYERASEFDENMKRLHQTVLDVAQGFTAGLLPAINSFAEGVSPHGDAYSNAKGFGELLSNMATNVMKWGSVIGLGLSYMNKPLLPGFAKQFGNDFDALKQGWQDEEFRRKYLPGGLSLGTPKLPQAPRTGSSGGSAKSAKQQFEKVSDWSPLSLRWESDFPWMQAGEDATGPAEEIRRIQDALDHLTGQDKVKELTANLALLQDAFDRGIIPVEQYDEAIQRLFADTVPDNVKKTEEAMRSVSTAITDAAADMVEAFTDTDKSIGESLQSILRSFLKTIARIQIESMLSPLNKAIPGFLGSIASGIFGGSTGGGAATGDMHFDDWGVGSALGNVFSPSGLMRFASGGVVSRPTMFAYGGGLGVMGEAGPEAVMPLKRGRDGKLGVDGGGASSSVVINISNTSSGAKVGNVQERRRGDGTREIAIAVEDIMDAALARGRYDSVLGAKYGVSPMGRR